MIRKRLVGVGALLASMVGLLTFPALSQAQTQPTLSTTASPAAITLPAQDLTTLSDSAALVGGTSPTGKVVFTLTGPGGFTYTQTDRVNGNGTYKASTALPTTGTIAGTYTWTASYGGDNDNAPADDQGGSAEQTVVNPASPTLVAAPGSPSVITLPAAVPTSLTDSAVLSSGVSPTGSITFTLTGPAGFSYSQTDTVTGNGTYTADTTLPIIGTIGGAYTWTVSYSGDDNNNAASGECGPADQTTVSAATPTLVATADPSTITPPAADPTTLTDSAVLSGGVSPTGRVVFTVTGPGGFISTQTDAVNGNGTYTANATLPTPAVAGTYQWDATYSGDANNNPASDINAQHGQTTVGQSSSGSGAGTTTVGQIETTGFDPAAQTVPLSADVTSPAGTVDAGAVTFTVRKGSTTVGTPTAGVVSDGTATASYPLPAGTAPGTYTIVVDYSDPTGSFAGTSTIPGELGVAPTTTTCASSATTQFSSSSESVNLSATLDSPTETVNKGTVTFTVRSSGGTTVGSPATSPVDSQGGASIDYVLPAGTAAGTYTIEADYSDPTGSFLGSSNSTQTLTVTPAASTTTASSATTQFSSSSQDLTLAANVTSNPGTVNEGKVTFTLRQGDATIGTPTTGSVTNGSARVSYALPAGTAPGTYAIEADYSDSAANLGDSSDVTQTLTVAAATTTTASSATTVFDPSGQNVTLSAAVSSAAGTVDEGNVSFRLLNSDGTVVGTPTTSPVSNGKASVDYALPAGTAAGTYTIEVDFADPSGSFDGSSDKTGTLTVTPAPPTPVSTTTTTTSPTTTSPTTTTTTPATTASPPPAVSRKPKVLAPSNHIAVSHIKTEPNGTITFQVNVPGRGRIDVLDTAWDDNLARIASVLQPAPHRFATGRMHATAKRAGVMHLKVSFNASGERLVRHHRYAVVLRLWVSYTPTGGSQHSVGFYGLHLPK